MEFALKALLSLLVVALAGVILRWVWSNQIDVAATARKASEELVSPPKWVATRDDSKIYQAGREVGNVIGAVGVEGATVTFAMLSNTSLLQPTEPFEYKRYQLKVTHISGKWGTWTTNGVPHQAVLKGVKCVVVN